MNKRGQMTIFIIIGLLVLFLAVFGLYLLGQQETTDVQVPTEAQPVKLYIDECLNTIANNGIELIASQGGYLDKKNGKEFDEGVIAYGYANSEDVLVTINDMESEIEVYINSALPECIDFKLFEDQGYNFSTEEITSKADILTDKVIIDVRYPIEFSKGTAKYSLERFSTDINQPLGDMHSLAQQIVEKTIEDPEYIDTDTLSENNYNVDLFPLSPDEMGISINMVGFAFIFVNKYDFNQPPILDIPSELRFTEGEAAIYQVTASDPENDPLTFSDDTSLFDITQDGVILFTPDVPGEYDVTISVEDKLNEDSREVKIIVE